MLPRVLGLCPAGYPDARMVAAVCRAGGLGVLDVGLRDPGALDRQLRLGSTRIGVRLSGLAQRAGGAESIALPPEVVLVVLDAGIDPAPFVDRCVLVQVTSGDEGRAAAAAGACGLIAKGAESGGRVGAQPAFVLFQELAAELDLPIWVQGGIGPHTAAACVAGGAAGVVVDSQLALLRESRLPAAVRSVIAAMDGSETAVVGGHRVLRRPDLPDLVGPDAEMAQVEAALGWSDPRRELIAVGQDAGLARGFAARYATAGGLVRALETAMDTQPRAALQQRSLVEGAPLARAHGTRFPVLQGPMTRVSDCAEFAGAVAVGGGLPFLALALMRGREVRALLEATAERLGDRPWGVGILGFVPAELRAEQLGVLEDLRPSFAIIAGGRPAQARALEQHGITAYLHVPSPGLLELFLKEGARRFVFEGRECGGHVGPRSSFALWEAQLEVLRRFDRPEELALVFAGGIHDGRSAAMVAAMGAPLAARGAQLGVLMGTAYLFTEEIVSSGAVVPDYQATALACDRTVLLETAPGHATRCVETDYVVAFQAERARLEAEGLDGREVWARLEHLNLGRLRVASKGVERRGDELVDVDAAAQRRDGMYMIGQVAALRSKRTTVEALHREVGDGSVAWLERTAVAPVAAAADPLDVAVVGMACVFPGAPDLETYWHNILEGVDAIREVPDERWNSQIYYDPEGPPGETTPSKWGGFLDPVPFDPSVYGIPPKSLASIEPVQLLSLEIARRALEDAGYGAEREFDRTRTAVVFGAEAGTDLSGAYGFRALFPQLAGELPAELDGVLPKPTEDTFPGILANVIAGRIANRLDLGGANFTVDAACAASLAAVQVGVQGLRAGTADMVLAGGADLHNSIHDFLMFSSVHALSPSGRCNAFDERADGIVLGEGVGVTVLKRLADAERDGDRIYAVIKGLGASSDGKSLGLTAPRKAGQVRALERAYSQAGIVPADVGMVEAHGTGTVVGDRTELDSMDEVFAGGAAARGRCTLGSVKSQIGHTKCAAGMAALIKVVLALHRRTLPPTRNVAQPNPYWDAARSPFVFRDRPAPWVAGRRVAALSAFGFGGTNFHCVLEEPRGLDELESGRGVWPAELFLFRGSDRAAALERLAAVEALLDVEPPWPLRDLACSAAAAGGGESDREPVQLAAVVADHGALREALVRLRAGDLAGDDVFARADAPPAADAPRVAFLFPGQGSQRLGMLAELFAAFPQLDPLLARGARWVDRVYPPQAFTAETQRGHEAALTDTRNAQPALGLCGLAMARLLACAGLRPDAVAGHSYGELVALCVAGALDEGDLLPLSEARGAAILAATGDDPGAMASITAPAADLDDLLAELPGLVVANYNAPRQTILSGPTSAIETVVEKLEARGIGARRLPVACAFHSGLVAGAEPAFAARLDDVDFEPAGVPVWSNTTAAPYPTEAVAMRALLARQLAQPVKFADQIEAMYASGVRVFVEVGPGRVLSGLVDKVLGGRHHLAVPTDVPGTSELVQLQRALGRLAVAGVEVETAFLYHGRGCTPIDVERPPARAYPPLCWMVNGQRAWPRRGDLPAGAMRPTTTPPVRLVPEGAAPAITARSREAAVVEYLANLRDLAESQRQVMLSFLGTPPDLPPDLPTDLPLADRSRIAVADGNGVTDPTADADLDPAVDDELAGEIDVEVLLLEIVSERTGYPADMLDLDLDLEADLSIDSIKRIEILGALNEKVGLSPAGVDGGEELVEELAARKTLRGILSWLDEHRGDVAEVGVAGGPVAGGPVAGGPVAGGPVAGGPVAGGPVAGGPVAGGPVAGGPVAGGPVAGGPVAGGPVAGGPVAGGPVAGGPGVDSVAAAGVGPEQAVCVGRYLLRTDDVSPAETNGVTLQGLTFAVTEDGGGVADALADLLRQRGAQVQRVVAGAALDALDGVVDLASLAADASHDHIKALFALVKDAVSQRARWVIGVTGMGGGFGRGGNGHGRPGQGGVAGLLKSLAKERRDLHVRTIDVDPGEAPAVLAAQVLAEMLSTDECVEVAYRGGVRRKLTVVAADHAAVGVADHAAVGEALPLLDPEAVVLLTGGARGITASIARALARDFRCRLELVGRSALSEEGEPAGLAALTDPRQVKRWILDSQPDLDLPAIEAEARRILAAREVRATLCAIEAAGSTVRYHQVDVRDDVEFAALLDEIYAHHGRLDGVLHGAGVIEDKLLQHKTPQSFDRVFDTKVRGALTLAAKLRDDVGFVVFFSSVSSAFGNRGQVDYAAANDVLDKLAHHLNQRLLGRVVSLNWGPWDSAGMVSPELRREYARRGVGLISLDEGADLLLRELIVGAKDDAQVILVNAAPETLA